MPVVEGLDLLISTAVGLTITTLAPAIKRAYDKYQAKQGLASSEAVQELNINRMPKRKVKRGASTLNPKIKLFMQVVVSLVFLGVSMRIIMSPSGDPREKQWAYASAGTILGFWLKH